jgi:hypothetical protein
MKKVTFDDTELASTIGGLGHDSGITVLPAGTGKMSVSLVRATSSDGQGRVEARIPVGSASGRRRLWKIGWSVEPNWSGTRYYTRRFQTDSPPEVVAALRTAYRAVYGEDFDFDRWTETTPVLAQPTLGKRSSSVADTFAVLLMVPLFGLGMLIGLAAFVFIFFVLVPRTVEGLVWFVTHLGR